MCILNKILSISIISILGVLFLNSNAFAARTVPLNESERYAKNNSCNSGGVVGALWLSSSTDNPYSDINSVTLEEGQEVARMTYQGSAYDCTGRSRDKVYATNIVQGKGESGKRMRSLAPYSARANNGHIIGRGSFNASGPGFTSAGTNIGADVYIGNAKNGEEVTVSIFRCYSSVWANYGSNITNYDSKGKTTCWSEDYKIKVKRVNKKIPNNFNVDSKNYAAVTDRREQLNSSDSRFKSGDVSSESNPQNAKVGQWVSFKHTVIGKDFNQNMRGALIYVTSDNRSGYYKDVGVANSVPNPWSAKKGERKILVNQGYTTNLVNATNNRMNETFQVTKDMVGKTICTLISGRADADGVIRNFDGAAKACVYVPYEYDSIPCIVYAGKVCEGGDVPIPGGGNNTPGGGREKVKVPGGKTPSKNTQYKITTWKINASDEDKLTPTNYTDNISDNTCSTYSQLYKLPSLTKCQVIEEGRNKIFNPGENDVSDKIPNIEEGDEAGTRYCIALSISPYRMTANENRESQENKREWRHSAPVCIKFVKKPKVQFWGNGVYAKAGIATTISNHNIDNRSRTLGSWVEYESISGKILKNFKTESSHETQNLSINNTSSSSAWGQGSSSISSLISSIIAQYPKDSGINNARNTKVFNNISNIGGHSLDFKTEVYYGNNIRITGDIVNPDRVINSENDFRQSIIVSEGDIYIDKDVANIDAWLIAKGTIYTCTKDGKHDSSIVNGENCGKALRINGATISNKLKLWRTAGSSGSDFNSLSSPAEIINQRTDTYLWARSQSSSAGKIITTYTKELPVRY